MVNDPLPSQTILTPEQLAAIGCLAVESTYAETVVEEIIWDLCGLDENHGKHWTQGVQMNNRLELLSTIGKQHLSEARRSELVKIIGDMKDAVGDRNTVIHGVWERTKQDGSVAFLHDHPDPQLAAMASKRRPNTTPATYSAGDIQSLARKVRNLRDDLLAFVEIAWPDTWRRIFQPLP